MKTAATWIAPGATGAVPLDANGNPTAIPTGASLIYTLVALDPSAAAPIDTYELTYGGTASFQVPGATIVSSQPGKLVFRMAANSGSMQSVIVRSIDPNDTIHDVHIVRQDEVAAFNHGELFNSEFLAQVSNWQVLRFMDWENTNVTTLRSWESRSHVTDATWAANGNSTGVPIEVMIQLANEARTDMWFNIPTQAGDNYVRNALELIKDRLAPGLKVHVEYSNEVWNSGFAQSKYAQSMANLTWGVDANHDGNINPSDPAEAVAGGGQIYYGYRSAQIASIANSVFSGADDSRLEMVLATQTGNSTLERYWLDGIARANAGSVASLFDELAGADYFGLELSGYTAGDQAIVVNWAKSGEAGLAAAFQHMAHGGGGLSSTMSIDSVAPYLRYEAGVAARYGLDFVAYEGGFHGSANFYGAETATVMDFFARLMADPRMKDLYQYWLDTFEASGGTMSAAYTDVQTPTGGGYFGVMNSLYDAKTPRYQALLAEAPDKAPSLIPPDYTAILADLAATPHKATNDFNGDGRSDILWRSASQVGDWFGTATGGFTANSAVSNVSSDWKIVGTGDFNGDGSADLLWRNADGRVGDSLADSAGNFAAIAPLNSLGIAWKVAGTGDFDGDGRTDILWRNDTGAVTYWSSTGSGFAATSPTRAVSVDWHIAGTGDFNGDGRDDILWRNDNGAVTTWLGASGGFVDNPGSSGQIGLDWHIAGTGDFNGDGKVDILWRNDNGSVTDWLSTGSAFVANVASLRAAPLAWQIVGTGDYNGDGKDDISWRDASGAVTTWLSNGTGFTDNSAPSLSAGLDLQFGEQQDTRATPAFAGADFNGDGRDDMLWRHAGGTVTNWLSNGAGFSDNGSLARGVPLDWRIVGTGDFNGDGKADLLWRNADGTVTDWFSNGTGFSDNGSLARAVSVDWHIETTGDFNGDGRDDILWRNANGTVTDWLSNGTNFSDNGSVFFRQVSADWHIVATGDFNGDGRDDIVWRNADGTVTDWLSNGAGFSDNGSVFFRPVSADWSIAGTGDFNGDGRTDILWRNADGSITDWLSNGSGFSDNAAFFRGVPLDWQIMGVGDFNGDGRDDIEWRASNGIVTDWLSNGSGFTDNPAATRAVPLDWAIQHEDTAFLI